MIFSKNSLTFKKLKRIKAVLVLVVLLSFLGNVTGSPGLLLQPCYGGTLSSDEMAGRAIDFINDKYQSGEALDGFTAYALGLAGEDLAADKWTTGNKTLKKRIEDLADLLGDCNSLISYITSTQNGDGSFGPLANEYGTKAPLQALAAVKADTAGLAVYAQVNRAIENAVSYYKNGYQSGNMPYDAGGWGFDYRCVEALIAAGEDISTSGWVYGGRSLQEEVIASAGEAVANPAALDVVTLAKELTVLRAVYPASPGINILADTIIAKKDVSTPGQIRFGSSIYDDVVILTALGKAGRLGDIDQSEALNYLNDFKHAHNDSWGTPSGAAWGGYYPEESDLTAQVLTALSYFHDAAVQGSEVYNCIQEGLTYLADIQDPDTAAITHEWDSTFATAETLIALKSFDKSYGEYAGAASAWVKKSRTKTIAQCLLAVSGWPDNTDRRDRLAALLAGRQKADDPGRGSFENSVYSDMWAYLALGEAGKISIIDAVYARDYILSKQGMDGSWGESFGADYYPDFLSTTQAIRSLTYLPDASGQQVRDAIDKGLAYLKGLQQADGGIYSTWDDPAIDNSELIVTLYKLNQDPSSSTWENTAGLTPVDYLLHDTMNSDGSFGTAKNSFGAAEALSALLLVTGQGNSNGDAKPPTSHEKEFSVKIAVVGANGELLYGPDSVTVSEDDEWGATALGALAATGLNVIVDRNSGFVSSVDGQANSGMNGWMYKINGVVAMVAAKDKKVSKGDRIIWWYSGDMASDGPDWDSLMSGNSLSTTTTTGESLPAELPTTNEALSALENLTQLLGIQNDMAELGSLEENPVAVAVIGEGKLPARSEFLTLKQKLAGNPVNLSGQVEAATGAVITDSQGKISLVIPGKALKQNLRITVKEKGIDPSRTFPGSYRQITPVYELEPDNTRFSLPVTIALKIAVPPLVKSENLALARYNQDKGIWVAVPAVVDAGNGVLLAKIDHFSEYAVLARQETKSFDDVNSNTCGWAVEAVELLAGAGVIDGVDGKYFQPDRSITRAELTSILVKALRLPAASGQTAFTDVPAQEWYAGSIAAATQAGLVKGYDNGTFRPDGMVTREELATVLARGLNLTPPTGASITFSDAGEVSAWAKESLTALAATGLVQGYPDGTFQPRGMVTRAECAVFVYRALIND
jgi:hypothetical protein